MFIVAEIGANHNGSLKRAIQTIDAAADAGADGVKFQTFTPEQMAVHYKIKSGPWEGRDLVELYREAHTPRHWHQELFDHARGKGLVPFSTPFHKDDVDFLETLDCPIYKIASYELVDLELVEYAAKTGKPMFISCGQANKEEIWDARCAAWRFSNGITLLHCVSEYPTELKDVNLKTMIALKQFNCDVGISDHSPLSVVAILATSLGASVIEKHLTLSKDGLDKGFSMLPSEFKQMVNSCREVEQLMGEAKFDGDTTLRRSLYYNQDIKAGTTITKDHIKTARPNLGLSPIRINEIIGTELKQDVSKDEAVKSPG